MGAEDVEVAGRFLAALEAAAESGDREAVYPLLAPDVEWVTPKRTLRGIDEIGKELIWGSPPENLDLEFEAGDWVDLGDRRVACDVHEVYRWKETGELLRTRPAHRTDDSRRQDRPVRNADCGIGRPRPGGVYARGRARILQESVVRAPDQAAVIKRSFLRSSA